MEAWFATYRERAKHPAQMEEVPLSIAIPSEDWDRIKRGRDAKEMEDRWVIGYAVPFLEFYRSWTDTLVFKLAIETQSDGVMAGPLFAARVEDWYRPQPPDKEVEMVRKVLEYSFGFVTEAT